MIVKCFQRPKCSVSFQPALTTTKKMEGKMYRALVVCAVMVSSFLVRESAYISGSSKRSVIIIFINRHVCYEDELVRLLSVEIRYNI